ncbi:MAG: DNA repair protein RadA [Bacteroidota bacterium]
MAKSKTIYVCSSCGVESAKWVGKCPSCNSWNSFKEFKVDNQQSTFKHSLKSENLPKKISEINVSGQIRMDTKIIELNRVLGGGLVMGSVILVGGEPGIGKSTLLLQMALNVDYRVLYVSGEESEQQIKMRSDRVGAKNSNCYVLSETSLENVFRAIDQIDPEIIIIDSIQTMYSEKIESSPGTISQIRENAVELLNFAKKSGKPVFLIGHINKDGNIAGPKVLEHIVDVVLQFEGDQNYMYRILRSSKNRFGSATELGVFEMYESGLEEVLNPSDLFLSKSTEDLSGVAVASTIEGIRPFLIEVQALVSSAVYGTPQRAAIGFDYKRMNMLLAVLEKRAGFRLATKDVFLNITGGLKVKDPAIDLAIICSILSSDQELTISKNICFAGEIGLSGEIRAVDRVSQRIKEAEKLGFKEIYVPYYNKKNIVLSDFVINVVFVKKAEQVFEKIFG